MISGTHQALNKYHQEIISGFEKEASVKIEIKIDRDFIEWVKPGGTQVRKGRC